MKKHIFVLTFLSMSSAFVYSQNNADYDKYVAEAGDYLNLYRGTTTIPYNYLFIGTYYAFSDKFEKGELRYNGKIYEDVEMNLNSHLDELYVKIPGSGRTVMLNKEFAENFSLGTRNFVYLAKRDEKNVPRPGFYEILYNGQAKFYKKIQKEYFEKIASTVNSVTKSRLEKSFDLVETYYLLKDKVWYKIPRRNSILAIYKEKRNDIRRFMRKDDFRFITETDLKYEAIMKFIESPSIHANE